MKKLSLITALFLVVGMGVASAAKPTTSVTISGPNGTLAFKESVWFQLEWQNVTGNTWPMMTVNCFQDVNNDGTIDTDDWNENVYSYLTGPGSTAPKDGTSQEWFWLSNDNQWVGTEPARCRAQAYTYSWKEIIPYGSPIYFEV